jgi:hypothetical protein
MPGIEPTGYDQQGRGVVRVKDKDTGHKYTELVFVVEGNPDAYQVLKGDAVDAAGRLIEPEYATSSPAPSGQKATTTEKENG